MSTHFFIDRFIAELDQIKKPVEGKCCGVPARVARCSRIPVELVGGFAVKRGENGCGSDEHEEHGEYSHTQQEVKDSFAHTGDRTGPTQPHGEFRRGEFLSPEGGIELHDEVLINRAHSHTNKGLVHS